jgi:phosphoribosylformylglycinamidine synthase
MAKIVAGGGDYRGIRFSFQEYFRRMSGSPERWSQPFAALLGAYDAQIGYGLPSIGGKDSMSGTFNDIDVPPTLVSFAVNTAQIQDIISPELKEPGNALVHFAIERDEYEMPVYEQVGETYRQITGMIAEGEIVSAFALDAKGLAAAISKMAFGNKLGVKINEEIKAKRLFKNNLGDILAEVTPETLEKLEELDLEYTIIGNVMAEPKFVMADFTITIDEALTAWTAKLTDIFPVDAEACSTEAPIDRDSQPSPYEANTIYTPKEKIARPTVFIPVLPGTNGEYDMEIAFERAGAKVITKVFRNLTPEDIRASYEEFAAAIDKAHILAFAGGFSLDDEPDGSTKFTLAAFQNEMLKDALMRLLDERDGLALGIGSGFQAMLKLGLIEKQGGSSPALTYNTINRHISKMVYTKVVSNKSPWLAGAELGGTYVNPASCGTGRFVAAPEYIDSLFKNGQVATCYATPEDNVFGSAALIEGITSPDGRCFGKILHAERHAEGCAINIYGQQDMKIFESGVRYFS